MSSPSVFLIKYFVVSHTSFEPLFLGSEHVEVPALLFAKAHARQKLVSTGRDRPDYFFTVRKSRARPILEPV
jgi:hypothetical protein